MNLRTILIRVGAVVMIPLLVFSALAETLCIAVAAPVMAIMQQDAGVLVDAGECLWHLPVDYYRMLRDMWDN